MVVIFVPIWLQVRFSLWPLCNFGHVEPRHLRQTYSVPKKTVIHFYFNPPNKHFSLYIQPFQAPYKHKHALIFKSITAAFF